MFDRHQDRLMGLVSVWCLPLSRDACECLCFDTSLSVYPTPCAVPYAHAALCLRLRCLVPSPVFLSHTTTESPIRPV